MSFVEALKTQAIALSTLHSRHVRNSVSVKQRLLLSVLSVMMVITTLPVQRASAQVYRFTPAQAKRVVWQAANKRNSKSRLDRLMREFRLHAFTTKVIMNKDGTYDNAKLEEWKVVEDMWQFHMGCDLNNRRKPCTFKGVKTIDQVIHTFFDVAATRPAIRSEVARFRASLTHKSAYIGTSPALRKVLMPSVKRYSWERLLENQTKALQFEIELNMHMLENSAPGSAGKKAAEAFFRNEYPPVINFNAQAYAQENKAEPIFAALVDNFEPDGSLTITDAELTQLANSELDRINDGIGEVKDVLGEIDGAQQDPIDYANNPAEQARQRERAEAEAAEHALKIQASRSAISIVSDLAGLKDPKLARQLSVVGNVAIDVYETGRGWLEATAGLSSLESIASLSTVVATGNMIGAAMQIISLFGPEEPAPEQLILEEIGRLREQISDLRTEMHERFDRIDEQLDTIYTTMLDRFDKIDVQLGKINGSLVDIQETLMTLDNTLARMERNNFEFLDAGFRRDLLSRMNSVLEYKTRTGLDLPYEPQFVDAESYFYTWATTHAFDALAAGPTQRDYSDARVLSELNSLPPDANLNYLDGWLKSKGLPGIANERIASPRDWLFAARAYVQLAQENPTHMRRILANNPQRIATLESVGADIEKTLRSISTLTNTANSTITLGNTAIFSNVLAYYDGKRANLQNDLQRKEAAFITDIQTKTLERATPFDLFGGAAQTMTHQIPELVEMTCGNRMQALAAPDNIDRVMPNLAVRTVADYLRMRTHNVCVSTEWDFVRKICSPKPPPDEPPCQNYGHMVGTLTVRDNMTTTPLVMHSVTSTLIIPMGSTDVEEQWDNEFKRRFETLFASINPSTIQRAEDDPLAAEVEARLASYQRRLYEQNVTDLTSGNLVPSANELAGAKQLLETFVNFGFNDALESDDYFHGLMFGGQSILNREAIVGTYTLSATLPITGMNILENPRSQLSQVGNKRSTALRQRGMDVLSAIGTLNHQEFIGLIANARQELRLVQNVDSLIEPEPPTPPPTPIPPGSTNRVFFPMVVR